MSLSPTQGRASYTLSLEEKVGQLLMVHFRGEEPNDASRKLIEDTKVGGFIYFPFSNILSSPRQVSTLSAGLQSLAAKTHCKLPLLIAIDQEGGIISRLTKGFTVFPGNKALGVTQNPELAYQCALAMGKEMRSVGINMNLAPVVDVNSNPRNPIIGVRSFGEVAEEVTRFASAALRGFHEAGVATTLKHFPGHGDVEVDSHLALPTSSKSRERLDKEDLFPFFRLSSETDAVMTAHMLVPALDKDTCATLSKKTIAVLRNEAHFQKLIISDSLVMEGVLKIASSVDEAAVRALQAGCDMLILGGQVPFSDGRPPREVTPEDAKRIHTYIVNAVKSGRISMERLDEAVDRILCLKEKYAFPFLTTIVGDSVSTYEHQILARKVASLTLQATIRDSLPTTPLRESTVALFAPKLLSDAMQETTLPLLGKETKSLFFDQLNPSPEESKTILDVANQVETCIFCSYNAWKNPGQAALIQSLLKMKKTVLIIATRDSLDAELFPTASYIITTFSPTAPSLQAAAERIVADVGSR